MKPTKRTSSLVSNAVFELERLIFNGKFASGTHIKELEIASMLGISRSVVREAFMFLTQSGLVEIFPHRGVFVRSFTLKETLDMFDLRAHMALLAVREASQNLTPRKATELASLLDQIDEAHKAADPTLAMELNWRFHQELYDLCDNKLLRQLADDIRRKQFLSCRHTFRVHTTGKASNAEHRDVLDKLTQGDGEGAAQSMYDHVMAGKRRFLESVIPDHREAVANEPEKVM